METGHRSVLVMDAEHTVAGIVAITDLLKMIMPAYLSASKPSTADRIQYSPMFWNGMFSAETRKNSRLKVRDVMSPAPQVIDGVYGRACAAAEVSTAAAMIAKDSLRSFIPYVMSRQPYSFIGFAKSKRNIPIELL